MLQQVANFLFFSAHPSVKLARPYAPLEDEPARRATADCLRPDLYIEAKKLRCRPEQAEWREWGIYSWGKLPFSDFIFFGPAQAENQKIVSQARLSFVSQSRIRGHEEACALAKGAVMGALLGLTFAVQVEALFGFRAKQNEVSASLPLFALVGALLVVLRALRAQEYRGATQKSVEQLYAVFQAHHSLLVGQPFAALDLARLEASKRAGLLHEPARRALVEMQQLLLDSQSPTVRDIALEVASRANERELQEGDERARLEDPSWKPSERVLLGLAVASCLVAASQCMRAEQ